MNSLEQAQIYLKQESCIGIPCIFVKCIFNEQCNKFIGGQINIFQLNRYKYRISKQIIRQAKLERISK
jgi:hypothetical protein